MGKPLVRFREGQETQPGYGRDIVAPSRKQVATEKTNFFLQSRKAPVYSKKFLADLSARLVALPPDQVDDEIRNALKEVLEFFRIDHFNLLRLLPGKTHFMVTHN